MLARRRDHAEELDDVSASSAVFGNGELVPLKGKRLRLDLLRPEYFDFLYYLLTEPDVLMWRYGGSPPSRDEFIASITTQSGALASFVAVHAELGAPIGLVWAYAADFRNRHAHLGLVMDYRFRFGRYSHDVAILFVNYVFNNWDFRKLYGEVIDTSLSAYVGAIGRDIVLEGTLKDHYYWAGTYRDMHKTAIYREHWRTLIERRLPGVLGSSAGPAARG